MSDDDETRVERDEDGGWARDPEAEPAADIEVPWERLSPQALRGVIEEFVTREGTEYGAREVPLETKVAEVQRQLERGEVIVLFDARAETVNLVTARDLRKRS